jgi:hypothetical protein
MTRLLALTAASLRRSRIGLLALALEVEELT